MVKQAFNLGKESLKKEEPFINQKLMPSINLLSNIIWIQCNNVKIFDAFPVRYGQFGNSDDRANT